MSPYVLGSKILLAKIFLKVIAVFYDIAMLVVQLFKQKDPKQEQQ
jgi:hypothetical protein